MFEWISDLWEDFKSSEFVKDIAEFAIGEQDSMSKDEWNRKAAEFANKAMVPFQVLGTPGRFISENLAAGNIFVNYLRTNPSEYFLNPTKMWDDYFRARDAAIGNRTGLDWYEEGSNKITFGQAFQGIFDPGLNFENMTEQDRINYFDDGMAKWFSGTSDFISLFATDPFTYVTGGTVAAVRGGVTGGAKGLIKGGLAAGGKAAVSGAKRALFSRRMTEIVRKAEEQGLSNQEVIQLARQLGATMKLEEDVPRWLPELDWATRSMEERFGIGPQLVKAEDALKSAKKVETIQKRVNKANRDLKVQEYMDQLEASRMFLYPRRDMVVVQGTVEYTDLVMRMLPRFSGWDDLVPDMKNIVPNVPGYSYFSEGNTIWASDGIDLFEFVPNKVPFKKRKTKNGIWRKPNPGSFRPVKSLPAFYVNRLIQRFEKEGSAPEWMDQDEAFLQWAKSLTPQDLSDPFSDLGALPKGNVTVMDDILSQNPELDIGALGLSQKEAIDSLKFLFERSFDETFPNVNLNKPSGLLDIEVFPLVIGKETLPNSTKVITKPIRFDTSRTTKLPAGTRFATVKLRLPDGNITIAPLAIVPSIGSDIPKVYRLTTFRRTINQKKQKPIPVMSDIEVDELLLKLGDRITLVDETAKNYIKRILPKRQFQSVLNNLMARDTANLSEEMRGLIALEDPDFQAVQRDLNALQLRGQGDETDEGIDYMLTPEGVWIDTKTGEIADKDFAEGATGYTQIVDEFYEYLAREQDNFEYGEGAFDEGVMGEQSVSITGPTEKIKGLDPKGSRNAWVQIEGLRPEDFVGFEYPHYNPFTGKMKTITIPKEYVLVKDMGDDLMRLVFRNPEGKLYTIDAFDQLIPVEKFNDSIRLWEASQVELMSLITSAVKLAEKRDTSNIFLKDGWSQTTWKQISEGETVARTERLPGRGTPETQDTENVVRTLETVTSYDLPGARFIETRPDMPYKTTVWFKVVKGGATSSPTYRIQLMRNVQFIEKDWAGGYKPIGDPEPDEMIGEWVLDERQWSIFSESVIHSPDSGYGYTVRNRETRQVPQYDEDGNILKDAQGNPITKTVEPLTVMSDEWEDFAEPRYAEIFKGRIQQDIDATLEEIRNLTIKIFVMRSKKGGAKAIEGMVAKRTDLLHRLYGPLRKQLEDKVGKQDFVPAWYSRKFDESGEPMFDEAGKPVLEPRALEDGTIVYRPSIKDVYEGRTPSVKEEIVANWVDVLNRMFGTTVARVPKPQEPELTGYFVKNFVSGYGRSKSPIGVHSGGADGADTVWAEEASKLGIPTFAYGYKGMWGFKGTRPKLEERIDLSYEELETFKDRLARVADILGKKLGRVTERNGLIYRNAYQVEESDAVIAVSTFGENATDTSRRTVSGGTGWAVEYGILKRRPVYLFDLESSKWFEFDTDVEDWIEIVEPPVFTHFAGIGTREITANGKKAIRKYLQRVSKAKGDLLDKQEPSSVLQPPTSVTPAATVDVAESAVVTKSTPEEFDRLLSSGEGVYIGRAGRGQSGEFGNPFKLPNNATEEEVKFVVDKYRRWLWEKIQNDPDYAARIYELKGKNLVCPGGENPELCHGQVIKRAIAWLDNNPEFLGEIAEPIESFKGQYSWLSNFADSAIDVDGIVYPTVEHAFQAAKYPNNPEIQKAIAKAKTPAMARQIGRAAGNKSSIRPDWNDARVQVMLDLLRRKFDQNPELKQMLIDTGKRKLVEGNTWNDKFWGVSGGEGENVLGKLLMQLRDEYRGSE